MTKRVARDIIAVVATGLVLGLFAWYMSAATDRAIEEANRSRLPPVLTLKARGPYEAGKNVWVEVELSNPSDAELRAPDPAWPAVINFELEGARLPAPARQACRKALASEAPPSIVTVVPRGRLRRRVDLARVFELPAGEYVVRARYDSKAKNKKVWAWTPVSDPVRLKVLEPRGSSR